MNRSKVISSSFEDCPLSSTWRSISADDSRYASACSFCSAAVGGGGSAALSGEDGAAAVAGFSGASLSSGASFLNSPSEVKSRRSVTVKLSVFFSAMDSSNDVAVYVCVARATRPRCSIYSAFKNPRERKRHHTQPRLPSHKFFSRNHELSPSITQCEGAIATRQTCNAGEFSDVLSFLLNPKPDRRSRTFNLEARKHAMNRPARPDPLHNLLPDVAALAEIQSPVLPRFLRKVPLPDVDAEFRNAASNAKSL